MIPYFINTSVRLLDKQERFLEFLNQTAFCSQFEDGKWYCYILLVFFTFALPVGILGNLGAIINYTCFQKSWTSSRVLLLNLALCDSAWIFTLPVTIYFSLQRPYLKDIQVFCQFKKVFFNINIYGSILFLTLVSFDRFAGTVHPIGSLRWWGVGRAKLCTACAWVALFLGSIPDLFVAFAVRRPDGVTACMDHIQGPFAYVKTITVVKTLLAFGLPFGVMLVFYVMTVRALRGRGRRLANDCGRLRQGSQRGGGGGVPRGGKPLRLLTAALVVFVVSFVPYHVMIITLVFMRCRGQVTPANTDVLYASYEFVESLCSVSSCLDPIIYILDSEKLQSRLLACRRGQYRRACCRASRRVESVVR